MEQRQMLDHLRVEIDKPTRNGRHDAAAAAYVHVYSTLASGLPDTNAWWALNWPDELYPLRKDSMHYDGPTAR